MIKILGKILPSLVCWGIFAGVILIVPYPESFTQAKLDQIILFFIPLFLALILTFNIFLNNLLQSFSITLALIFFLILKALDSLNLVTGILILAAAGLLFSYFKKAKHHNLSTNSGFKNLTKYTKIPRLTRLSKLRKVVK